MIQVTYTSEATDALRSGDVFRIVTTSSTNNDARDLTGFLIFSGDRFFQLLEGPDENVNALLAKLECDPRHTNITVLERCEISQRAFPAWKMKRIGEAMSPLELARGVPELERAPLKVRKAVVDFLRAASISAQQPLKRMHG